MNNYPIEKQVCTLEQAKKLAKLLGDDAPESLWVWQVTANENNVTTLDNIARGELVDMALWPAYTGDELGALLPGYLNIKKHDTCFCLWRVNKNYACCYEGTEDHCTQSEIFDSEYEAHAKAELAITGLEEGWIKPEEFQYETT